jgi:(S)-sulfolactate dehydrogenase
MPAPVIVIPEFMEEGAVARLAALHPTLYDPELSERSGALGAALIGARALIVRTRTQVNEALLDSAPRLEIVGRLGAGLDNIDLAACAERGVAVHPAAGGNADAVAEYVIAAALTLMRGRAFRANAAVIAGDWPRRDCIGGEIAGKVMGLYGYGRTGRAVASRAAALGMRVIAHDPFVGDPGGAEMASREALLAAADVLSLHFPLNAGTRNLIFAAAIGAMKPGAILINAARGGVLDEAALVAALKSGRLGGAALDVFAEEPLGPGAGADFAGIENLILTPHVAGVTRESSARVSGMIADIVLEALA